MAERVKGLRSLEAVFKYRREHKAVQEERDKRAPKAGELAPDFTLRDATGEVAVTLSDFRGKRPVALIFGSFT
jgi:peroxiredoxin